MSEFAQIPLGDVCTVNPRSKKSGYPMETIVSFVPMAAVDERTGSIAIREERPLAEVDKGFTSFEDGDVLFAKITPCMENGKVAMARNLVNGIGRGSTEFYILRPGERVMGEYLYHVVRQPRFREEAKKNFTGTAGQQRVPKSFIQNVLVPLPPIAEQRRIVSILNRAAKIERLRRQAQERLREFLPALFVKMFGDPATNPMDWPLQRIGSVCVETGQRNPGKHAQREFRYVDISGIDNTSKRVTKSRRLLGRDAPSRARKEIQTNDVLVSTVSPQLNTAAMVPDDLDGEIASTGLCALRANPNIVEPFYLFAFVTSEHFAGTMTAKARGAIFPAVSDNDIKETRLPLPPLRTQQRFADIAKTAENVATNMHFVDQITASLNSALMSDLLETAA